MPYTLTTNVPSIDSICAHPVDSIGEAIAIWNDLNAYGITDDDRLTGDGVVLDAHGVVCGQILQGRFFKRDQFNADDLQDMQTSADAIVRGDMGADGVLAEDPAVGVVPHGEPNVIQQDWRDLFQPQPVAMAASA